MKKKKDLPVRCRAFPAGSNAVKDELIVEWCRANMHKALCKNCPLFPANGPEVSIYQKKKF